jgi:nucleolar protein 58
MNLAKCPASTVQILGAEKALFRALKTKRDTPKYGLIYHAQLIGHAPGQLKGKVRELLFFLLLFQLLQFLNIRVVFQMSRMLAAKAAMACRVDALGEDVSSELGTEHRAKLELRIKQLQEAGVRKWLSFFRILQPN